MSEQDREAAVKWRPNLDALIAWLEDHARRNRESAEHCLKYAEYLRSEAGVDTAHDRRAVAQQAEADAARYGYEADCFGACAAALRTRTDEVGRLLGELEDANIELSALLPDPRNPDWMPALTNGNVADAQCLSNALAAIRRALAGPGKEEE